MRGEKEGGRREERAQGGVRRGEESRAKEVGEDKEMRLGRAGGAKEGEGDSREREY